MTRATWIQRKDSVKNTFVDIAGKLPLGLVELYGDISTAANTLGIDVLVIGAMARDLVLVHGYGSTIERGTRDVDFGINVASWDDFEVLKAHLVEKGFIPDKQKAHKLTRNDTKNLTWEIDIVPFGSIATPDNQISWPPDDAFVMSVLGFSEALASAQIVQISEKPEIIIPVASPAGMALLKLIAWTDREVEVRKKDAMDFAYLIQSYTKIPEIFEAVYEEGFMEVSDWDELKASAMKLGRDAGAIANPETRKYLNDRFFSQKSEVEQFSRDMQGTGRNLSEHVGRLESFAAEFHKAGVDE